MPSQQSLGTPAVAESLLSSAETFETMSTKVKIVVALIAITLVYKLVNSE